MAEKAEATDHQVVIHQMQLAKKLTPMEVMIVLDAHIHTTNLNLLVTFFHYVLVFGFVSILDALQLLVDWEYHVQK